MKKSEAKEYIKELIVAELSVEEGTYVGAGAVGALQKDPKFAAAKDKTSALNTLKAGGSVTLENEEFEDEPTAKDIAANASIAKLQSKYTDVVKQMKWKAGLLQKLLDQKICCCGIATCQLLLFAPDATLGYHFCTKTGMRLSASWCQEGFEEHSGDQVWTSASHLCKRCAK